ncbi:MAG: TIR domain-containing protein [Oceanibaculum nanhaiense]|uniref:TIR domain-containing protein n=1 Tax=Oceanibaculum nanhaiense TaxID=1909734 RepID=UPI0025A371D7|nr:TIR domain-containing protein [Oceanibaculum nanhaiense]MDM7945480.1 TIR domain-containing protein [Oceanibaculum nanhaiense]
MSALDIVALLAEMEAEEQRKSQAFANALASYSAPPSGAFFPPPEIALNLFGNFANKTTLPALPAVKRRVFYSFHYADIIRVNNVRNTERFKAKILEVPQSHYDRSLWESSKCTSPENLKRLIREGIENTSVVCVLIGTYTWARPWVRHEIARSVIDQKGLLAVDLNSIRHHHYRCSHPLGPNPLSFMAVGKMQDGTYRLFERNYRVMNGQWQWCWDFYGGYTAAVPLPKYLPNPAVGYVSPLDLGTFRYDACQNNVWENMPIWLNIAATRAGRD